MANEDKSTALIIRNPKDLNQALVSRKDVAHLLTPYARTDFELIARGFVPTIRTTFIDPNPINGEVYDSWDRPGEKAITKVGLTKLGQLAGVNWVDSRRVDDGKDPHFAEYTAEGKVQDMDGTWHNAKASRAVNLRDDSTETKRMKTSEQLMKARQNIAALAESKAKNRVLRELLGLAQSYKPDEFAKPFVVLKLAPDMEDPEVRRIVQAQQLGVEKFLFPQNTNPMEEQPGIPVLPPTGTKGLDVGDVPKVGNASTVGPIIDIKAEESPKTSPREEKIKLIESLYYERTEAGKRDPSKPALSSLSDIQLDQVAEALNSRPKLRPPANDLI